MQGSLQYSNLVQRFWISLNFISHKILWFLHERKHCYVYIFGLVAQYVHFAYISYCNAILEISFPALDMYNKLSLQWVQLPFSWQTEGICGIKLVSMNQDYLCHIHSTYTKIPWIGFLKVSYLSRLLLFHYYSIYLALLTGTILAGCPHSPFSGSTAITFSLPLYHPTK